MNSVQSIQDSIQDRYNQNIEFFRKSIPGLISAIESTQENLSLKFDPHSKQLFKEVDGESFYPTPPIDYAMGEVKSYYEMIESNHYAPKPSDLMVAHVIKKNPFLNTLQVYANSLRQAQGTIKPHYKDIVIFGCGLGHHIEMLLNKRDFNSYTIIEKNINNFKESLYCVNWGNILNELPNNKYVSFIIKSRTESHEDFERRIQYQIQESFPSSITSTLIYNHRTLDDYKNEKQVITDILDYGKIAYEKLAPDAHRLLNLNHNAQQDIPVINLQKTKFNHRDTPIAIIGAGPSLDMYLPLIKEKQDAIYIVSCGSSLGSLLKNGITPDFHFELEYQNLANELIKYTHDNYSFKGITFISSLEAHPKLYSYFDAAYSVIPETTELYENIESQYILSRGGITCTNGAAALFSQISSSDILLVGLDFAHTKGSHHAKDNITNVENLPGNLKRLEEDGKTLLRRGTFTIKDVYGNDVNTTPSLNSARLLMETLAESRNNTFINFSYGADIPHTHHHDTGKAEEYLTKINTKKPEFILKNSTLDSQAIHGLTEHTFRISFSVSDQVLNTIKGHANDSPLELCQRITSIYKSIKQQTGESKRGQFRSIMSINRLPLLLIFNIANYTTDEYRKEAIDTWIEDYTSYIDYVKNVIYKYINSKDYYVEEDWNEE